MSTGNLVFYGYFRIQTVPAIAPTNHSLASLRTAVASVKITRRGVVHGIVSVPVAVAPPIAQKLRVAHCTLFQGKKSRVFAVERSRQSAGISVATD
jgi:hypothetical protein